MTWFDFLIGLLLTLALNEAGRSHGTSIEWVYETDTVVVYRQMEYDTLLNVNLDSLFQSVIKQR